MSSATENSEWCEAEAQRKARARDELPLFGPGDVTDEEAARVALGAAGRKRKPCSDWKEHYMR